MCLALLAFDAHPVYAVVIAANRDEFHARPTAPAHWWDEGWLAGRDLAAGGTWLGVTRRGRWALVTNVRDPARNDPAAPSRGALVPQLLGNPADPGAAMVAVVRAAAGHNGFNLLGGDCRSAHFGSNRDPAPPALSAGIHGVSNATLDTAWPKVVRTKAALARWCAAGSQDVSPLFAVLADAREAPDAELPHTGVPLDWERRLSAPFIVGERYGTRGSTIVALGRDRRARFIERTFDAAGQAVGDKDFRFELA